MSVQFFSLGGATKAFEEKAVLNGQEINKIELEARQNKAVWNENSYRLAIALFKDAAEQYRQAGNYQKNAECLREAADLTISLNEYDNAWQLLSEALTSDRRIGNIDGESLTLAKQTLVAIWKKNLKSAEDLQQRAAVLAEKNKTPLVLANSAFASAEFYYRNQRNLAVMTELQEKSLQYYQQANDVSGQTQTLTMLAYTAVMNNDRQKGQNLAAEAVNLAKSSGNSRDLAFALIAYGDALQRTGDWQNSLQAFQEAESIYPENLDHSVKAILFVRFGFHYEAFGDLIQARSYFLKARELFIKTGNLYGNSELTTRIGQISLQLGEKDEALKNFNEGYEIGRQANDKYSMAYAYENIGEFYNSDGDLAKAHQYFQKALVYFDQIGIKHAVASVKQNLGKLFLEQKNFEEAARYLNEALEIQQKIRSKNGQAGVLFDLAKLYQKQGNIELSLKNIEECLRLTEIIQNETTNRKLKQSFTAEIYDRFELYIHLVMSGKIQRNDLDFSVNALKATEKSRSRVLLENIMLAEADFKSVADSETVKREQELRTLLNEKANSLTDLLSSNAPKTETDKLSDDINELENALENIKSKLKEQSPLYSEIKNPAAFDVSEFQQKVLDENSMLLEFSLGKEESYLWLIEKDKIGSFILPPRAEIEPHIEKLRELLASREMKKDEAIEDFQRRIAEAESRYKTESKILSEQLFGQIADKISNKRLIVVPDGKLHYFPIAALPLPNSESDDPILLTNETVYAPSAQTLLFLEKSKRQNIATAKNLLIFSDPVFTADDARFSNEIKPIANNEAETVKKESFRFVESLNSLPRLTASKNESDSILNIVGAENADSFSGFDANRERLLQTKTDDYKIIHFATHGLTDEKRPELSGIVLSRFGENGQQRDEFFRIHDIYGLNLKADLVVLSACETGLGKEVKGEGLMSLNNAFLQTGAKSVMSSLWKVEDNATLELMRNFYQGISQQNLTPAQSLRQAQIKLRQNSQTSSPFYWAAFTVQGDFKNIPKISRAFDKRFYLLSFIPLILLSVFLFRKKIFAFASKKRG